MSTAMPATAEAAGLGPVAPDATGQMSGAGVPVDLEGFWGKTANDFVNMMGETPEERQKNLMAFVDTMGKINELGQNLGQTTLMQRIGQKKGAEIVSQAQAPPPASAFQPTTTLDPGGMQALMSSVGLGPQAISEATRWRG